MDKTALQFYKKTTEYIANQGENVKFTPIFTQFLNQKITTFYGNWKNIYGQQLIVAETSGVKNMATIKMRYVPELYKALVESEVIIVKNADSKAIQNEQPNYNNVNLFTIIGSVDNQNEANKTIEFKVRRLEKK